MLLFGFVYSSIFFESFFHKVLLSRFATIKTNEWFNEKLNIKAPKFNGYISKLIVSIYKKKIDQQLSQENSQSFHKFEKLKIYS